MGILLKNIANVASATLGKIALSAASEKILTRFVLTGIKKLASKTTNTVDDELVSMIANELGSRNLPEAYFIKTFELGKK